MPELRALTVRQPWAAAICYGKNVENRNWRTSWSGGLLAIHAGSSRRDLRLLPEVETMAGIQFEDDATVFGAVVAVADFTGCHLDAECWDGTTGQVRFCSPWAVRDSWHWQLADVRPLAEPVPCKGKLGLWRFPDDVEAAVLAQVPALAGDRP